MIFILFTEKNVEINTQIRLSQNKTAV